MPKLRLVLSMLLVFSMLLAGCAGTPAPVPRPGEEPIDPSLHAIYINQYGELTGPGKGDPSPGDRQDPALAHQDAAYVARIIEHFKDARKTQPELGLTIFVHGGLNRYDTAWRRAETFAADMLRDRQYVVFVGWNAGGITNYFDHLLRIRAGENNPRLGIPTSPLIAIGDLTRSIVNIPTAWYRTVADPASVTTWYTNHVEIEYERRIAGLKNAGFHVVNNGPHRGVGASYWTILNPVKLLTAPAVDGLGSGAWDSMLRRTDLVLSKPLAYEGKLPAPAPVPAEAAAATPAPSPPVTAPAPACACDEPQSQKEANELADTAVTRFLKEWSNDDSLRGVKINLIGHSMGSIVANNILARHPALHVDNVVFMGAAAPIKDIENGVVPWMRRPSNTESRFYNLSLDPYREIGENDAYDFLPRGSLLHWIDNIFGEVNSFKDRSAGGWWNIIRTAQDVFPEQVRQRVHLTRFPIGRKAEMGPQEHGQFDNYCFWREAYWRAETPLAAHPACATPPP